MKTFEEYIAESPLDPHKATKAAEKIKAGAISALRQPDDKTHHIQMSVLNNQIADYYKAKEDEYMEAEYRFLAKRHAARSQWYKGDE